MHNGSNEKEKFRKSHETSNLTNTQFFQIPPPQANWTNLPTGLGCNGVKIEAVSGLCRVNDRTPVGQLFNQLFTRAAKTGFISNSSIRATRNRKQAAAALQRAEGRERGPHTCASSRRVSIPRVARVCTHRLTVQPGHRVIYTGRFNAAHCS